jgi:hypothetical protein
MFVATGSGSTAELQYTSVTGMLEQSITSVLISTCVLQQTPVLPWWVLMSSLP